MGLFGKIFKSNKKTVQQRIIEEFYADYPEIPFISEEREEEWIERAKTFPKQNIVQKAMMKRYADGLLAGHIYMLYWLGKYTNKKVPVYFEYKYGIDFEKEKIFLFENGFLNAESKPTEKGEKAIKKYYKIIENHAPAKPDCMVEGISKQILLQRDNIVKNGFNEYTYHALSDACDKCKKLNGKHFKISMLEIGVNAPPMHEGCRCSISAYENYEEYERWLNDLSKGKRR